MKAPLRTSFCLGLLLFGAPFGHTQLAPTAASSSDSTAADPKKDCLSGAIKDLKDRLADTNDPSGAKALAPGNIDVSVFVCYLATSPLRTQLLGKAEQKRLDKQPGATSNSSGSTSLVSKGSSPSILGLALEYGGLSQSTNGNTITFRGNVANSIRALMKSTYLGSYRVGEKDPLVQAVAKLSFGISFDTSSNPTSTTQGFTPNQNNFSGFSAKYDLLNHRDPRDHKWHARWVSVEQEAVSLTKSFGNVNEVVQKSKNQEIKDNYNRWHSATAKAIDNLSMASSDEQIRKVVQDSVELFGKLLWNLPDVQIAVGELTPKISSYLSAESTILDTIRTSPVVTLEYTYTRQLTTNNKSITATQPNQQLPNLSNINLVYEKGFQGANAPEFTFNAGVTLFNSTSSTPPKHGTVRDFRASAQLDVPLKEIANIGKPVLSFSGQFLGLLEEPLGQKVTLNGVTIDRRGNMGIFQTKLSIPIKDSGIKIPISFTYASRTELIKEKDVRGNIGITFDLDTLFSKMKP